MRQRQDKLLVDLWVIYGCLRLGFYSPEQAQAKIRQIRDQLTPENRQHAIEMFETREPGIGYDKLCLPSAN